MLFRNSYVILLSLVAGVSKVLGWSPLIAPGSLRAIPYELVDERVQATHASKSPISDLATVLYEINEHGVMYGPGNTREDLFALTQIVEMYMEPSTGSYSFNGQDKKTASKAPKIRRGNGYTIVCSGVDDSIVSVWNSSIALKPLDPINFPGIFIDTCDHSKPLDRDLGSSERMLPPERDVLTDVNPLARQTLNCADDVTHYVELAVAYDNTFCALYGNSEAIASAIVQAAVLDADSIFQRDTCISIVLTHIEAHCEDPNDPYAFLSNSGASSDPTDYLFEGFKTIWKTQRTSIRRDLAYFFTGFEDGTGVAGVAHLQAACQNQYGYGWVEQGDTATLIHELGHSLSAPHTSSGIMRPMLTSDPPFFALDSIQAITQYVDNNIYSSCVDTQAPTCDLKCPGRCIENQCVSLYDSKDNGLVPCLPVEAKYRCTKTMEYYGNMLYFADECPSGYDYILPVDQAENAFCCLPTTDEISEVVVSKDTQLYRLQVTIDGAIQYINGYVYDTSVLQNVSLVQSTLIPSCNRELASLPATPEPSHSPVEAQPSESLKPHSSESTAPNSSPSGAVPYPSETFMPSNSPIPSQTYNPKPSWSRNPSNTSSPSPKFSPYESFNPNVSYSPKPSIDDKGPTINTTCSLAMKKRKTFRCSGKRLKRVEVPEMRSGFIRIRLQQRSGLFQVTFSTGRGKKMLELAALITTNPGLLENDIGDMKPLSEKEARMVIAKADAFEMQLPSGAKTCCREKLFIYMKAKLCDRRMCRISNFEKREHAMQCTSPCKKIRNGTVIPFSSNLECPTCLT